MIKQITNIVFFLFIHYFVYSQNKTDSIILPIPQKYNTPLENITLHKAASFIPGTKWEVFSDRMYNRTYLTPNCKKVKNILKYLEKYYVSEEDDDCVHLVKEIKKENDSNLLEDIGWIKKEDMLLWNNCLLNKDNFVDIKAILIRNDFNTNLFEQDKEDHNSSKYDYQIFYVLKKTKTSVLLSKLPRINIGYSNISEHIIGWVSNTNVIIWDNINVLEPNWIEEAAQERQSKNLKACIFSDKSAVKKYMNGKSPDIKYCLWDNDSYSNRKPGKWLRFPILNNENKIIKTVIKNKEGNSFEAEAYCGTNIKNLEFPVFTKVLLFKSVELPILLDFQKEIIECLEKNNPRQELFNLYKLTYYDNNWTNKDQDTSGLLIKDICNVHIGAFNSNGILNNYKVKDFLDEKIITDKNLDDVKIRLTKKHNDLNEIYNKNNYTYSFKMNGIRYYWIPEDYLP